ncbi:MAG: hypothetical protein OXN15_04475 [Chloroflexota bacterium]|nr:hypothetical protein [Chloroflexota bacterium]
MTGRQRTIFRQEAAGALFMLFIVGPATMVLLASAVWGIGALLGLPANALAIEVLGDSLGLLLLVQIYVVILMLVPGIFCMLSDPVGTRLAMWALGSSLCRTIPRLFYGMAASWEHSTGVPPAEAGGVRFAFSPRPTMPAPCFSPGTSPQLE